MRALAVLIALGAAALTWIDGAGACSCADRDERDRLEDGEIGVLGRVLERRTLERTEGSQRLVSAYEYRLRVQRGVGARFGGFATVRVPEDGCGSGPTAVGRRLAAFVRKRSFGWLSSGCSVVAPGELERALRPYPRARGTGRLALLAGGSFGSARVMALDLRGRILGYGFGDGEVRDISACPGSELAVELAALRGRFTVALRDLHSLRILWRAALPALAGIDPDRAIVHCADPAGTHLYAAVTDYIRRTRFDRARIFSASANGTDLIATLRGFRVAFGNGRAFVGHSKRVQTVDLDSGAVDTLRTIRFPELIAPSPDGRWLAVYEFDRLHLVDLAAERDRDLKIRYGGAIAWLSDDRLLFRHGGEARVYDTNLELLRRYTFYRAAGEAQVGDRLFGTDRFALRSLDLRSGRRRTVARLPDRGIAALVGVPGAPLVGADPSAPELDFPATARGTLACRG